MVQVKKKNGGKEAIQYQFKIGVVGAGHIFGEKDFMNQEARTLTATVSSGSAKLYRLSFQVNSILKKNINVIRNINQFG